MRTKRVQKLLCRISTLTACLMLTGCGHEHTWVEATCTEAKTCSECNETEGEALGHTWVDATCAEPKTCSVCGEKEGETLAHTWVDATCAEPKHCSVCNETEGEALEHTLTEANYQQPATCEVCGETVGEPLQADFEKYGLMCNAEQNIEYPITLSWGENMFTSGGKITYSDYDIFDSDDTHEALEGYEWRAITATMSLDYNESLTYGYLGVFPTPDLIDYYCDINNTYNESTDTFTLSYNGEDYTDVKFDGEILQNDWNDDIFTAKVRWFCRVPKGYDGIVAIVDDAYKEDLDVSDLAKDNAFFRLK